MTHSFASRRRLALLGAVGAALGAWALPAPADACSCAPWLEVRAPAEDGVLPSNGLLVIDAECGAQATDLEVYVDGQRAHLVPDNQRMLGLGHEILPAPEPGAVVEVIGCPGFASCDEARDEARDGGEPVDDDAPPFGSIALAFTVGDHDQTAPTPPALGGLDYLLADVEEPCSFEGTTRPAREWSVPIDGRADEPVLYHVSVGPTDGGEPTRTRRMVLEGEEDLELTLLRFAEDAGHDVCATVRTFDLTGNEADPVRTCTQLGRRETLTAPGCACAAGGGGSGWAGAGLLLLWGGAMRRRRDRRGATAE